MQLQTLPHVHPSLSRPGGDWYVNICGCGPLSAQSQRCICGGRFDPARAYRFRFEQGGLTIRKPGDPVLWRMRCNSEQQARQSAREIVRQFESGKIPLDATHRGKAIERDMVKGATGEEPLHVCVSLSALLGD